MYLNLGKKGKGGSRRVTLFDGGKNQGRGGSRNSNADTIITEDTHIPASPYSFFYPESVSKSISLLDDTLDPCRSPEFHERCEFREKRKQFVAEQFCDPPHF
jgi:hypothetical protein